MKSNCKRYALISLVFLFIATGERVGLLPTIILGLTGAYFLKKFIETLEDE